MTPAASSVLSSAPTVFHYYPIYSLPHHPGNHNFQITLQTDTLFHFSFYSYCTFLLSFTLPISFLLQEVLLHLLQLGNVDFQVLVPLEFLLHRHDVLCVAYFPLVSFLEVFLELVQLASQNFPFILDFIELPCHVHGVAEAILLNNGFALCGAQVYDQFARVIASQATASTSCTLGWLPISSL